MSDDKDRGFYDKYYVERRDGKPLKGGAVVLEFGDPNSWYALLTWANTVERRGHAKLAQDIREIVSDYGKEIS